MSVRIKNFVKNLSIEEIRELQEELNKILKHEEPKTYKKKEELTEQFKFSEEELRNPWLIGK